MSSQVSDPSFSSLSFRQPSVEPAPPALVGDAIWLAFQAHERATVYVSGEIDIATAPQLTAAMREALLDDRDLTVDLSRVAFFGVSGLNALAQAMTEAEQAGRTLRVVGATDTTRQLLQISGFERLLAATTAPRRLSAPGEQVVAEGS